MPILELQTNVPQEKITTDVLKELSATVAKALHKPESYVVVRIQGGQKMTFGGSEDPCAYGFLKSIGGVGGAKNNSHAETLFPVISKHLGIKGNRMYIEFINASATDIAFDGQTFA